MINIKNIQLSEIITDPWDHKIVDNFFEDSAFYHLEKAAKHLEQFAQYRESISIYPFDFEKYGIDPIVSDIIISASNKLLNHVDNITNSFPIHGNSYQGYFSLLHFAVTGKDFKFNIHTDSSNKVLTAVTYISEGSYRGTMIYRSHTEDSYVKDIEWKQNRSFIICPVENKDTWHNWENYSDTARVSINLSCQKIESLYDTINTSKDEHKDKLINWMFEEMNNQNLIVNKKI